MRFADSVTRKEKSFTGLRKNIGLTMPDDEEVIARQIVDTFLVDDAILTKKERIRNAKQAIVTALTSHALEARRPLEEEIEILKKELLVWKKGVVNSQEKKIIELEAAVLAERKKVADQVTEYMLDRAHEYDSDGEIEKRNVWAFCAGELRTKLLPKEPEGKDVQDDSG
ncbi:hypothetical protein KW791_00650 [Candidatus Parcubacteria bacterium]|nr:hypothetical protein [Candidatus Parcubacteria bacterium]